MSSHDQPTESYYPAHGRSPNRYLPQLQGHELLPQPKRIEAPPPSTRKEQPRG